MDHAHCLRFARALALAAVVPGCTSTAPTPAEGPSLVAETYAARAIAPVDAGEVHPDAHEGVDAGLPFSSGPVVPPELPEHFA